MKSVIVLMLLVAAMGLVTARPELDVLRAIEIIEEKEIGGPACCNDCGERFDIGRCFCKDLVLQCSQACKSCIEMPYSTSQGPPLYQCVEMGCSACLRKCDYATTVFKSIS